MIAYPDHATTEPAAARGTSDRTPGTHAPAPQPLPALILTRAAHLIETAWTQDVACDLRGGVCLEYAVFLVGHRAGLTTAAIDEILDAIAQRLGMPARIWNDAPGRTQVQVVTLLRSCAAEARTA
jgi:hypothetical protein